MNINHKDFLRDFDLVDRESERRWKRTLAEGVPFPHLGVHLLQPMSYMNRSGGPLKQLVKELEFWAKVRENVLVVYDDVTLPLGQLRLRALHTALGI